jgi:hypothetical protein
MNMAERNSWTHKDKSVKSIHYFRGDKVGPLKEKALCGIFQLSKEAT